MKLLIQVISVFIMVFAITTGLNAQKKEVKKKMEKKELTQAVDMTWEDAKEAYHKIMAGTFHPAEEGDLEPLKAKYKELAIQAKQWASIPIPEKVSSEELKKSLQMLVVDSNGIGELVAKGASDEKLTKAMFALHDIFHEIVGLCDH